MIHSQHDTAVDMDSSVNKSAGHQHRLCSSCRSTARRKQRIDTSFRFSDIFDCEYKIFWQSFRSLARARTSISLEAKKTMESKTLCVIYWQICSKINKLFPYVVKCCQVWIMIYKKGSTDYFVLNRRLQIYCWRPFFAKRQFRTFFSFRALNYQFAFLHKIRCSTSECSTLWSHKKRWCSEHGGYKSIFLARFRFL